MAASANKKSILMEKRPLQNKKGMFGKQRKRKISKTNFSIKLSAFSFILHIY